MTNMNDKIWLFLKEHYPEPLTHAEEGDLQEAIYEYSENLRESLAIPAFRVCINLATWPGGYPHCEIYTETVEVEDVSEIGTYPNYATFEEAVEGLVCRLGEINLDLHEMIRGASKFKEKNLKDYSDVSKRIAFFVNNSDE